MKRNPPKRLEYWPSENDTNKGTRIKVMAHKIDKTLILQRGEFAKEVSFVQLNEYETVLYILKLSQNLTWDCLLISVFFPCFSLNLHEFNLKLFSSAVQNNFRFSSGKFRENTEVNNSLLSSFGLIEKIWSGLIFIKLCYFLFYIFPHLLEEK